MCDPPFAPVDLRRSPLLLFTSTTSRRNPRTAKISHTGPRRHMIGIITKNVYTCEEIVTPLTFPGRSQNRRLPKSLLFPYSVIQPGFMSPSESVGKFTGSYNILAQSERNKLAKLTTLYFLKLFVGRDQMVGKNRNTKIKTEMKTEGESLR